MTTGREDFFSGPLHDHSKRGQCEDGEPSRFGFDCPGTYLLLWVSERYTGTDSVEQNNRRYRGRHFTSITSFWCSHTFVSFRVFWTLARLLYWRE